MKKKIWLAISALTMLSTGASAVSFDGIGKSYKDSRLSTTSGNQTTPAYQSNKKNSTSRWAPKVNLDNAAGSPKIALDNAYGNIKNTKGVSDDIKSQINKNAYEWVPNGTKYRKRNRPPYSSLDINMLGVRCNTPGTMRVTSTERHRRRHTHHHGHGSSTHSYTTTGYTYTLAKCK